MNWKVKKQEITYLILTIAILLFFHSTSPLIKEVFKLRPMLLLLSLGISIPIAKLLGLTKDEASWSRFGKCLVFILPSLLVFTKTGKFDMEILYTLGYMFVYSGILLIVLFPLNRIVNQVMHIEDYLKISNIYLYAAIVVYGIEAVALLDTLKYFIFVTIILTTLNITLFIATHRSILLHNKKRVVSSVADAIALEERSTNKTITLEFIRILLIYVVTAYLMFTQRRVQNAGEIVGFFTIEQIKHALIVYLPFIVILFVKKKLFTTIKAKTIVKLVKHISIVYLAVKVIGVAVEIKNSYISEKLIYGYIAIVTAVISMFIAMFIIAIWKAITNTKSLSMINVYYGVLFMSYVASYVFIKLTGSIVTSFELFVMFIICLSLISYAYYNNRMKSKTYLLKRNNSYLVALNTLILIVFGLLTVAIIELLFRNFSIFDGAEGLGKSRILLLLSTAFIAALSKMNVETRNLKTRRIYVLTKVISFAILYFIFTFAFKTAMSSGVLPVYEIAIMFIIAVTYFYIGSSLPKIISLVVVTLVLAVMCEIVFYISDSIGFNQALENAFMIRVYLLSLLFLSTMVYLVSHNIKIGGYNKLPSLKRILSIFILSALVIALNSFGSSGMLSVSDDLLQRAYELLGEEFRPKGEFDFEDFSDLTADFEYINLEGSMTYDRIYYMKIGIHLLPSVLEKEITSADSIIVVEDQYTDYHYAGMEILDKVEKKDYIEYKINYSISNNLESSFNDRKALKNANSYACDEFIEFDFISEPDFEIKNLNKNNGYRDYYGSLIITRKIEGMAIRYDVSLQLGRDLSFGNSYLVNGKTISEIGVETNRYFKQVSYSSVFPTTGVVFDCNRLETKYNGRFKKDTPTTFDGQYISRYGSDRYNVSAKYNNHKVVNENGIDYDEFDIEIQHSRSYNWHSEYGRSIERYTSPKQMNYGLYFTSAEMVIIYDNVKYLRTTIVYVSYLSSTGGVLPPGFDPDGPWEAEQEPEEQPQDPEVENSRKTCIFEAFEPGCIMTGDFSFGYTFEANATYYIYKLEKTRGNYITYGVLETNNGQKYYFNEATYIATYNTASRPQHSFYHNQNMLSGWAALYGDYTIGDSTVTGTLYFDISFASLTNTSKTWKGYIYTNYGTYVVDCSLADYIPNAKNYYEVKILVSATNTEHTVLAVGDYLAGELYVDGWRYDSNIAVISNVKTLFDGTQIVSFNGYIIDANGIQKYDEGLKLVYTHWYQYQGFNFINQSEHTFDLSKLNEYTCLEGNFTYLNGESYRNTSLCDYTSEYRSDLGGYVVRGYILQDGQRIFIENALIQSVVLSNSIYTFNLIDSSALLPPLEEGKEYHNVAVLYSLFGNSNTFNDVSIYVERLYKVNGVDYVYMYVFTSTTEQYYKARYVGTHFDSSNMKAYYYLAYVSSLPTPPIKGPMETLPTFNSSYPVVNLYSNYTYSLCKIISKHVPVNNIIRNRLTGKLHQAIRFEKCYLNYGSFNIGENMLEFRYSNPNGLHEEFRLIINVFDPVNFSNTPSYFEVGYTFKITDFINKVYTKSGSLVEPIYQITSVSFSNANSNCSVSRSGAFYTVCSYLSSGQYTMTITVNTSDLYAVYAYDVYLNRNEKLPELESIAKETISAYSSKSDLLLPFGDTQNGDTTDCRFNNINTYYCEYTYDQLKFINLVTLKKAKDPVTGVSIPAADTTITVNGIQYNSTSFSSLENYMLRSNSTYYIKHTFRTKVGVALYVETTIKINPVMLTYDFNRGMLFNEKTNEYYYPINLDIVKVSGYLCTHVNNMFTVNNVKNNYVSMDQQVWFNAESTKDLKPGYQHIVAKIIDDAFLKVEIVQTNMETIYLNYNESGIKFEDFYYSFNKYEYLNLYTKYTILFEVEEMQTDFYKIGGILYAKSELDDIFGNGMILEKGRYKLIAHYTHEWDATTVEYLDRTTAALPINNINQTVIFAVIGIGLTVISACGYIIMRKRRDAKIQSILTDDSILEIPNLNRRFRVKIAKLIRARYKSLLRKLVAEYKFRGRYKYETEIEYAMALSSVLDAYQKEFQVLTVVYTRARYYQDTIEVIHLGFTEGIYQQFLQYLKELKADQSLKLFENNSDKLIQ